MVSNIGQYILSVITASFVSSIILRISGKNGKTASVMKMLCGVFLICTVISPWLEIHIDDLNYLFKDSAYDVETAVAAGQDTAQEEMREIIKQKVEAYISTKASQLKADVRAEVIMSKEDPMLPEGARLTGPVSPHARRSLTQYIADELGIPEEKQIWI